MLKIKGAVATLLAALTALEPTIVLAQATSVVPPTPAAEPTFAPTQDNVILEGAVDAKSYIVGPGDRLLVELWGVREQSTQVEVNAEGRLSVPHVGVFGAGGERLATVRDAITSQLHKIYPNLHANVTLARPRTFLVNVIGAVARAGPYPANPLTRVSTLVPRASPLPTASTRRVEIRRKGRAEKIIGDIVAFTVLGDPSADPTVLDGDTIFVPVRELEVEVAGAVKRPGRYELVRERNVRELLELSGGLASDAATTLPLRLTTRESGDRLVIHSLPQASAAQTVLHAGDTVHVPALTDLRRTVVVEGAIVGNPNPQQQGGAVNDQERRTSSDRPVDPVSQPGNLASAPTRDVSIVLNYSEGEGVSDLIVKVGGLQPWADGSGAYLLRPTAEAERGRIAVDVVAISSRKAPDIPVQPGDTLVIPSRRDAVVVGGAVQHPGLFPYSRTLHPPDYITLAGGPTRSGSAGSAQILKRNGQRKDIGSVSEIDPGDVISVPEVWLTSGEWVTVLLIVANLIVSTTTIILLRPK
jgi:protein involved in polysaccharide export with SLBB domain